MTRRWPWEDDALAIPGFLQLSPEARAAGWASVPPPRTIDHSMEPRNLSPEAQAFIEQQAAEKKTRARNRIARMLAKKEDHTGQTWDSRTGRWVDINPKRKEPKPMMTEVGISTVRDYPSHYNATRAAQRLLGGQAFIVEQTEAGRFTFRAATPNGALMKPVTKPAPTGKNAKTAKIAAGPTGLARRVKPIVVKASGTEPATIDKAAKKKPAKAKAAKAKVPAKKTKKPDAKPASGKRAEIEAAARSGKLPEPPDFSADTHKPHRAKLAEAVSLAKAGDLKALKAMEIKAYSSSPKAIARYRDLAVIALEAKAAG